MSLEKANSPWSAKQIKGMVINGKINFDHIVQRSYVWEKKRKSAFIESMMLGYPIPPVFAKRVDNNSDKNNGYIYYIMDGKQRLSTVKQYLNDEFALSDLNPVTYVDDATGEECKQDVSKLKFSELPESLKHHLETVSFSVTYFDHLTKEEERELFKRLNAGKPLSAKSKLLASCDNIEGLLDIGSHKLFDEMLTEKSKDNKDQVSIVMKVWCMMNKEVENISFESKVFKHLLETADISESEKLDMVHVFNLIVNAHAALIERNEKRVAKKLYTETHLVSLVPFFAKAVDDGIGADIMSDWIARFFSGEDVASVSYKYNAACAGGSAKNANILARNCALKRSYDSFFKVDGGAIDSESEDADGKNDELVNEANGKVADKNADTDDSEQNEVVDEGLEVHDADNYVSADGGIWADIEHTDDE